MSHLSFGCHCPLCAGSALNGLHEQDSLAATSLSLPRAPLQPVDPFPYTNDYRMDALLAGLDFRWNSAKPLGTPVQVTYSFMTAKPTYGGTDDPEGDSGFSQFSTQQKAAVHEIMNHLQAELGITLVEVPDSASSYGQIRFGDNNQPFSSGYTWLPNSTGDDRGGDVWIDQGSAASLDPVKGSYEWATLVHEIGHSLGLKHPGNYNAGSAPSTAPENYLGVLEDNTNYTVMSYRVNTAGGQERDWYGMYDLLTLKTLYGSNASFNAGDTVHKFVDSDGAKLEIIDDASGYDTIDLSALTRGARVDMHPGAFSSVGTVKGIAPFSDVAASNNLSIDLNTVIEKLIGTNSDDLVAGNDVNNVFVLGLGTNTADGGAGIDTSVYSVGRSAAQVSDSGGLVRVIAPGINDTLTQIERLEFADGKLAFDLNGDAGITAKVIGAVLGPAALTAHPDYVGIGLSLLDAGMTYGALVQLALNAALGQVHTNAQVVNLLYSNVTGVQPSAAQSGPYVSDLNSGVETQASLGIFASELPQNAANINLIGLAQTGLVYL